jgi:polyisoprenyl-phosphate glycosyltransferase
MDNKINYQNIWTADQIDEVRQLSGPILIVGASGFIGGNLFHGINQIRNDVYACSRNPKKSWRLTDVLNAQLVNSDIIDYELLQRTIKRIKPQTIFNLSAYGAYSRQTDLEKIHLTNYIGTLNLIRAVSEFGCTAFVQAGTSSEYGTNCSGPKELSELKPNSDYAVSKVGASYLIKYYGKNHNFPCVNVRMFSVYGPWEERDRLIPSIISHGLQGQYPPLVNKDISRDFVYIDDCTNALIKTALKACRNNPGISINIATGIKTTIEDVANLSRKLFNIKDGPCFGNMPNRIWDLNEWYGDAESAKKILGWESVTSFEKGLKLSIEWEKGVSQKLKYVSVPIKVKKISAILACYKDNQAIPIMYNRLSKVLSESGYDYEIIFINDCSPLNDEAIISQLAMNDTHVLGISHSRNFGSQSAFLSGMELSTGDAVVLMDGDGQDPPELIPEFIDKWEEGFDIIYGERVKREASFIMQLSYKFFYRIFKKLSDVNIPVDAGDFSLINRKAVDHILSFKEKDVFLRGLRAWVGFKQIGVSYKRPERLFGKSTNNLLKNIWWAKKGVFSFSIKPLQYIQTIGFIVFLTTILLSMFYLISYFIHPPTNAKGIPTVLLITLGLGGIQLISVSILGDYIGKIIEEVKNRPKYIRDKIIYNSKIYYTPREINKVINEIQSNKEFFA